MNDIVNDIHKSIMDRTFRFEFKIAPEDVDTVFETIAICLEDYFNTDETVVIYDLDSKYDKLNAIGRLAAGYWKVNDIYAFEIIDATDNNYLGRR